MYFFGWISDYVITFGVIFVGWIGYLMSVYHLRGEVSSSVNMVSGYGLDDRAIEVQSSAEAKGFFV
jgi:hypothetical protein